MNERRGEAMLEGIETIRISAPGGKPAMKVVGGAGSATVITRNDGSKPNAVGFFSPTAPYAVVSVVAGFYVVKIQRDEDGIYSGSIQEIVRTNVESAGHSTWSAYAQVRTITILSGLAWGLSSFPPKLKTALTAAIDKVMDPSRTAVYVKSRQSFSAF